MITDEKLGVKIAESPREELVHETINSTERRILQTKLALELEENALKYLKELK